MGLFTTKLKKWCLSLLFLPFCAVKTCKNYIQQHSKHTEIVHDMQPRADLELIVVIPACNEKDFIQQCLASLEKTSPIQGSVEVLIIVNDGMNPTSEITTNNEESLRLIKDYKISDNPKLKILPVYLDISNFKKPGVGLVRKIGMDEAVRRFLFLSKDGIIVCLDADCKVAPNYFQSILNGFLLHPKHSAASIHFEHNFKWNKSQIIQYESHLRYFIAMQRKIKLPFAIQTVGSSMAVRSSAYCKNGGMNTRQAGEDFYFLQKFIANDRCFEINNTTVYPSDRGSQRVPFGTGRAIDKLSESQQELNTYNPNNFYLIQDFVNTVFNYYANPEFSIEQFQGLEPSLINFLKKNKFISVLNEIKKNTASPEKFQMRFYQWFNAFMLMKCLHSLRETTNPDIAISQALELYFGPTMQYEGKDAEQLLEILRQEAKDFTKFT